MKITKCVKAVGYAVVAVCLTLLAIWIVSPLHNSAELVEAYQRSNALLFTTACSVMGIGVYSFVGYTRRRREHRVDSWFFMAIGALCLLFSVMVILRFGGMDTGNYDTAVNAAPNLNIGAAGVLPLPFLVRGWILSCTARFTRRERQIACITSAMATAVYLFAIVGGRLMFQI